MLCYWCQSIFKAPEERVVDDSHTSWSGSLDHWSSLDGLRGSVNDGCFICHAILKRLDKSRPHDVQLSYLLYVSPHVEVCHLAITPKETGPEIVRFSLQPAVEEDENIPPASSTSTSSSDTMRFIQDQLRHCDTSHSLCSTTIETSKRYPTRLIDLMPVGDPAAGYASLVITAEKQVHGHYATLSHSWGGANIFKLKQATLSVLKDGVDLYVLPKTFRDAFIVARSLNIRYIWIDSLCIIQDSPSDWGHEARLMLEVYKNAYCNIAATVSMNSHGGLFNNRDPKTLGSNVSIVTELLSGTFRLVDRGFWDELDNAPLNKRAWVVQERLLSPRIIHFASEQVFWDCYETTSCEKHPIGIDLSPERSASATISSSKSSSQLMKPPLSLAQALGKWAAIVNTYSTCGITYQSDKVVAISGVANYLQGFWNIEYCAGLWRKNLEIQLTWLTGQPSSSPPSQESSKSRAPSWSWLAFDGPVSCTQPQMYDDGFGEGAYALITLATVTEVNLRHKVSEVVGETVEGFLRMRCILNPLAFDNDTGTFFVLDTDGSKKFPLLRVDLDNTVRPFYDMFFIPVYDITYGRTLESHQSRIHDASERRGILVELVERTQGAEIVDSAQAGINMPKDKINASYRRRGHIFHAGRAGEDGFEKDYLDMVSPLGKEHLPCDEYDPKLGHLITLI